MAKHQRAEKPNERSAEMGELFPRRPTDKNNLSILCCSPELNDKMLLRKLPCTLITRHKEIKVEMS